MQHNTKRYFDDEARKKQKRAGKQKSTRILNPEADESYGQLYDTEDNTNYKTHHKAYKKETP